MDNWTPFYIFMGIMAVIGVFSGIFAKSINAAMANLEYFSTGKVTDHHQYIPYD
ncbi:hypothetical protein [Desulfallas thermosapovorans]|uniref:Uncharacterized protein n=1 Tax=Desulfallas thermosapovorans DSM 6562 TaxID=1121431 RepID=A0A5S4ZP64_9FIRM|nr:hypothetical protein [Desulfallas thermosapovorans]TYO93856.1 hypothetical protein LX24_02536 [Desulfallas thermosapovorans DSM 6562]